MGQPAFQTIPALLGAGLNLVDAAGALAPGEARRLVNFRVAGNGRIESRKAAALLETTGMECAGVFRFPFYSGATAIGAIAAFWDGSGTVSLYRIDTSGQMFGTELAGWTGVTTRPVITGAILGQKLWLCGRGAGVNLSLKYYDAAGDAMVTPTFAFDESSESVLSYANVRARVCAEYANQLFEAGYGTENDVDRPEIVRFTYIGLEADPGGAGDAGEAVGYPNIFDLEDFRQVGERGSAVLAMLPVPGRLLFLSDQAAHMMSGTDRESFRLELIDSLRGITGTHAALAANGTAYWWNKRKGPCVFTGGGATEIGRKVQRRFPDIDLTTLVAAHVAESSVVRWYHSLGFLSFDYERGEWMEGGLAPFQVFCAGSVSQSSTKVSTGESTVPAAPSGPPTSFTESHTFSTARVGWTAGDLAAYTDIYAVRSPSPVDAASLSAQLDPGVQAYTFSGLLPSTAYSVKLRHRRNGQFSTYLLGSFTTSASPGGGDDGLVDPPTNLRAVLVLSNTVELTWTLGDTPVRTRIWFRQLPSADLVLVGTTNVNDTSSLRILAVGEYTDVTNLRFAVQHESAENPVNVSTVTDEVGVEGEEVEGPNGPPTSFAEEHTDSTATLNWTAGDLAAHTVLYLNDEINQIQPPGVTQIVLVSLPPLTHYDVKLRHVRGGQESSDLEGEFTTDDNVIYPPEDLAAVLDTFNTVELTWTPGAAPVPVKTRIWFRHLPTASPTHIATVGAGVNTYVHGLVPSEYTDLGDLRYLVQHESVYDPTNTSGFTDEVEVETE